MNTIQRPPFRERCEREATRDVVFLLQTRRWNTVAMPFSEDGEYGHDGDGIILGDTNERGYWEAREDAEYLTYERLSQMEPEGGGVCAVEWWETERVFLSREEATAYGESQAHNYRHGWRVYGVPSEGELAELIKTT